MKLTTSISLNELHQVAKELINFAGEKRIFLFDGEMGSGKTTLINTLCQALGVQEQTSSPTFSIVQEYLSKAGPVYHFDFYRIRTEQEAFDMGFEDYLYSGHYCFIEWPDKVQSLISDDLACIHVQLEVIDAQSRHLTAF